MSVVYVFTLNDYAESQFVTMVDIIAPNENDTFPAVSICMGKLMNNQSNTKRLEQFVKNYYEKHHIEVPKQ